MWESERPGKKQRASRGTRGTRCVFRVVLGVLRGHFESARDRGRGNRRDLERSTELAAEHADHAVCSVSFSAYSACSTAILKVPGTVDVGIGETWKEAQSSPRNTRITLCVLCRSRRTPRVPRPF